MFCLRRRKPYLALAVLALLSLAFHVHAADEPARPRLAVLLVFDQLRGDYLQKWRPLFGEGGFKRLQDEGAWFTNCHYPYAYTITAAGHASISTGTTPSRHGVIANDWYDRKHAASVTAASPPPDLVRQGFGPYRRLSPSVGDVLLQVLPGKSRVAALSIKERAAILLAALRAQICYWFDAKTAQFVTSPYYRDEPHSWVKAFNQARHVDPFLGKAWTRCRAELDYDKFSGPDNAYGEGSGYNQGSAFPHPFQLGKETDKAKALEKFHMAFGNSPEGNDLLLALAKVAITEEQLGQKDSTDLLCLSFSSNDFVGHCWGPDSHEVLDMTLRTDAVLKELFDFLDAKVGKGKYVVALSADHGVCPIPELSLRQGKDAGRVPPETLSSRAEGFLNRTFLPEGKMAPWFETPKRQNAWIYLNQGTLKSLNLEAAKVERALADWLTTQPGIQSAFTRTEMLAKPADANELREQVRRSFHPDASGDIMVILKPHYLLSAPLLSSNPERDASYRTSHGTPHPYDTHVPLLVMGPGIIPGQRDRLVAPQATASILSRALHLPAPRDADYPVPQGLFEK